MSSTRNSGPQYSHPFASTLKFTTRVLLVSTLAVVACCLFATPTQAQGSLPLGTIFVGDPFTCPQGSGWFNYTNGGINYTMNCFGATVSCPNTQDITVTFGYLNPVGKVPKTPQALGLVVYLDGDGGKSQGSIDYVRDYFEAGYEIVQMEWSDNWEQTYDPFPTTNPKTYGNVQNAACRPATFLNYIYQNVFLTSVFNNNNTAGMCAQGISGGSAAIAYALAYYGAGSYIDNAELVSGPVLSDIEQGCQVPNPQQNQWPVVCGQNGGNQYGCQLGGGSTWTLSPTYLSGTNTGVGNWTNDTSCANANGSTTMTTTLSQSNWLKQSIVDQSSVTGLGATPMFAYSNTAMSGWLCRSVVSNGVNCAAIGNNDSKDCPNNSSPQGQLFYANISSSTPNFALYATDACVTAEGVSGGNVPGYLPAIFHGTVSGFDAITDDMIGNSSPLITPKCIRRH